MGSIWLQTLLIEVPAGPIDQWNLNYASMGLCGPYNYSMGAHGADGAISPMGSLGPTGPMGPRSPGGRTAGGRQAGAKFELPSFTHVPHVCSDESHIFSYVFH